MHTHTHAHLGHIQSQDLYDPQDTDLHILYTSFPRGMVRLLAIDQHKCAELKPVDVPRGRRAFLDKCYWNCWLSAISPLGVIMTEGGKRAFCLHDGLVANVKKAPRLSHLVVSEDLQVN